MANQDPPRVEIWHSLLGAALEAGDALLLGARGSALAKCLADLRPGFGRPLLVVAPDPEAAGDIHNDICFYLGEKTGAAGQPGVGHALLPHLWPAWDILPGETDSPDVETASDQVAILRACLGADAAPWIVCSITSLLQPTLPPEVLRTGGLSAAKGMEISPGALIAHLVEGGLEPVAQVDAPGQYSRRGGIVDVFPLLGETPYRLDFFGDEIDSVRSFDPASQQSGAGLDAAVTLIDVSRDAFSRAAKSGPRRTLLDYLPAGAAAVIRHPDRIARVAGLYASGFSGGGSLLAGFDEAVAGLARFRLCVVPDLDGDSWPEAPWRRRDAPRDLDIGAAGWERLSGGFDTSLKELSLLAAKGAGLTIACNNEAEKKRLVQVLEERDPGLPARVRFVIGGLSRGFISEAGKGVAFVSDHELFGRQTPARVARKRYSGAPIADFAELRAGDYVVHIANGIARFEGLKTLGKDGAEQDFLVLRFAEDARIYVPLSHIDLVQRYIGLGEARPQLSKLGSAAWGRRKEAVEKAVRDIAQDLLATQAKRLASPGIALPEDDALVREFDASFPYDETPDQQTALDDIRRDQQASSPMERLLCGDVGFGKTEMAVRAAFRAVNAGRQAAVLVPTTILAEQHYRTFSQRMADYPVRIECLSRFRSPAEQKTIVENVRGGLTDIVVGTHRLLSDDVAFKNLGLVVIDEEQKFGVESKERLKRFRADVDILTMTATPIPRTLHMSLLGLRDISNLATPPRERHSVKTMVLRFAEDVIRRAVLRELSRGGQCFFLHNRVQNIDETAARLQRLVPEARFAVGHGQMPEGELLGVMTRFLDGKLDVLVCTTIIESGVDIPRVNTLLVNEADHFGLSELHQLRGRVGRYRHQAYAYFLVPAKRPISPEAQKRLHALQEYSELGSGFRIAMRDLEIRGAGNLLGVEQSGHIHMIGFDLYCRLLEKAVASQKGETVEDEWEIELDLGTRAFIPPEYIPAEQQRIEFYRRLTRTRGRRDLEAIGKYLHDRYGRPPAPVERCFADQEIRIRMFAQGLLSLGRLDDALAVGFTDQKVKRGVMLLRHAGFKATPLRKNQWRVEVPGADRSIEPGLAAAGMADRILAALEGGKSDAPDRPAKRKVEGGAPDVPPPPGAGTEPLRFFSSDMLAEAGEPKKPEKPGEPEKSAAARPAAGATGKPGRKTKGKSGAGAKTGGAARPEKRPAPALPGGARKTALLPPAASRPSIISLDGRKKPASAGKKAGESNPVKSTPASAPKAAGPEPETGPAKTVFGVEPYISKGQIGVVVSNTAFASPPFSAMTLVVGGDGERRFFLRCVGLGKSSGGRSVLTIKASGPEEAAAIAEAYLAAGEAVLYAGVVE